MLHISLIYTCMYVGPPGPPGVQGAEGLQGPRGYTGSVGKGAAYSVLVLSSSASLRREMLFITFNSLQIDELQIKQCSDYQ